MNYNKGFKTPIFVESCATCAKNVINKVLKQFSHFLHHMHVHVFWLLTIVGYPQGFEYLG
jgi:hypothetical protein